MGTESLVSIIVPTFNYDKFIGEALDSVLCQSYQNIECIVIDDGSTDATQKIVIEYQCRDPRIRYIYQDNMGVSAARNNGLRNAKGEFIQFLDADDLIDSKKIELQLSFLVAHPEVDVVYGDGFYFRTNNEGKFEITEPFKAVSLSTMNHH